ncbi:MAG: purine-nucleoside phosphorylase [Planctomycetota bacterium]
MSPARRSSRSPRRGTGVYDAKSVLAERKARLQGAVRYLRRRLGTRFKPEVGIILGTGLGGVAEEIESPKSISYGSIPGFPVSTVESHKGSLLAGTLRGRKVLAMEGRFHFYEGYTLQDVTFPVSVMHALGAETLVVTNACGGLDPLFESGDIMVMDDHINLMGDSPLRGPNDDAVGPRFPDLCEVYDRKLIALAEKVARKQRLTLRKGVYAALPGPQLETRAEYRMLRILGAHTVGMSTVPEALVALHAGMRILGFSVVTDMCLPDALAPVNIDHILATAAKSGPVLAKILLGCVEGLPAR